MIFTKIQTKTDVFMIPLINIEEIKKQRLGVVDQGVNCNFI